MKVFDDQEGARRSIGFFNSLPDHDKVTIVSDLNPTTFKLKHYYNHLFSLLSQVQRAISQFDDIAIGNQLIDLGLDETYARLFVSNIKKHAPTEEYQLRQISDIPDEIFSKSVPEIIKSIWDHNVNEDELTERLNVTKEQLQCVSNVGRTILNALARGDMTKETIREKYADKLSPKKFESLSNSLLVNQKHWYDSVLFANTQDSRYAVDYIVKQNVLIIKLLNEILDTFSSETSRERRQID